MENQLTQSNQEQTQSNSNQAIYWNQSELENIAKVLTIVASGQKQYGKEVNLKNLLDYFRLKLDGRYSVNQVIGALNKYTDNHNDIPAPADIINILSPEPPRISNAEYKIAIEQWKANGYKSNCHYKQTMNEYENQGKDERENYKEISQSMQAIGFDTTKLLKRF